MPVSDQSQLHHSENHVETHAHQNQLYQNSSFLSGIKQRLLSFIFRTIWNQESDDILVSSWICFLIISLLIVLLLGYGSGP